MPEIPEIKLPPISVPEIPSWQALPPQSIPTEPPVTLLLGFPVVDMPGCVETRNTQPGNEDAYDNDPKGNIVVCDGTVPSYNPPIFNPALATTAPEVPPTQAPAVDADTTEELLQGATRAVKRAAKKEKEPGSSSPTQAALANPPSANLDVSNLPVDKPCPPFGSKEIGSFNKLGTEVLAGYEVQNGECIKLWDPVPVSQIVNNYVPDAGPLASVSLTAAVATTTAIFAKPIASVLQRLAKPFTKKVVKKINQKLGRKEKLESLQERRAQQRHRNQAIRDLRRALGK